MAQRKDQRLNNREVSLDSPLKEDTEDTCLSFLPSEERPVDDQLADREAKAIIYGKLRHFRAQLEGKDAVIFDSRLLAEAPVTPREIGGKLGVSRERVRQIESRLKKRLKDYLEEEIEQMDLLQESIVSV